jgi:hypothetical protein
MATIWYYAHDENTFGPFSSRQLKELAATGAILISDTIWKQGIARGILACRVKNLFPVANVEFLKLGKQPVAHSAAAAKSVTEETIVDDSPPVTLVPLKQFPV